jgi:hypothetical protein
MHDDICGPADIVVRRDDGSYLVTARGMSLEIPEEYYIGASLLMAAFTYALDISAASD